MGSLGVVDAVTVDCGGPRILVDTPAKVGAMVNACGTPLSCQSTAPSSPFLLAPGDLEDLGGDTTPTHSAAVDNDSPSPMRMGDLFKMRHSEPLGRGFRRLTSSMADPRGEQTGKFSASRRFSAPAVLVRPQLSKHMPPGTIAKRLADLLLEFPMAATGGVRWRVLAWCYEERHGSRLDFSACPTTLLWNVLRFVEAGNAVNPLVAVEDEAALAHRPGLLGCWPSLYAGIAEAVQTGGLAVPGSKSARELPLSDLRQSLRDTWHAGFDETNLGFFGEQGQRVRVDDIGHLVELVLQWRNQRVEWQQDGNQKFGAVDEALLPPLQLVDSAEHGEMIRCTRCREGGSFARLERNLNCTVRSVVEQELACLRAKNEEIQREVLKQAL